MKKRRIRRMLVAAVAAATFLVISVPAHAVYELGFRDCGSTDWVKIKSQTYGNSDHQKKLPGGNWQPNGSWYDATWTYHYSHTGYQETHWYAGAGGGLNYTATYSYCVNYG